MKLSGGCPTILTTRLLEPKQSLSSWISEVHYFENLLELLLLLQFPAEVTLFTYSLETRMCSKLLQAFFFFFKSRDSSLLFLSLLAWAIFSKLTGFTGLIGIYFRPGFTVKAINHGFFLIFGFPPGDWFQWYVFHSLLFPYKIYFFPYIILFYSLSLLTLPTTCSFPQHWMISQGYNFFFDGHVALIGSCSLFVLLYQCVYISALQT